jgi:hypothetical protein
VTGRGAGSRKVLDGDVAATVRGATTGGGDAVVGRDDAGAVDVAGRDAAGAAVVAAATVARAVPPGVSVAADEGLGRVTVVVATAGAGVGSAAAARAGAAAPPSVTSARPTNEIEAAVRIT